ncbi:MAG: hypothetical protein MUF18_04375 [Fimbriiglobus sp.]|jgi:hypothetical protein|nr:hypothetical protein [Fimbriiglobus sp.]
MTAAEPVVVRYPYVVSMVFVTLRYESRPYRVQSADSRYFRAIPYLMVSLLFGWWGLPWGPIQVWRAVWDCLDGGLVEE